jgi:hypothetical protein
MMELGTSQVKYFTSDSNASRPFIFPGLFPGVQVSLNPQPLVFYIALFAHKKLNIAPF